MYGREIGMKLWDKIKMWFYCLNATSPHTCEKCLYKKNCLGDTMDKKMKMYKVTVFEGANPCTVSNKGDILTFLDEVKVGDSIRIDIIEMTQAELDNLPEWDGP
jgi:uncharacterized protein (UPF0179 family)